MNVQKVFYILLISL